MEPNNNPTPMPNSSPEPAPGAEPVPPVQPAGPAPTPATAAGGMTTPPVNPIINPTGNTGGRPEGLAATDPIMRPEPAPEPDPVEEELKAPMVAAAPVPGSIGSAVSGAADDRQVPNVAFNDPAMQPDMAAGMASAPMAPVKKKSSKTTLIALIAVAAIIVVVLAVILAMQLMGGNQSSSSQPNTPTVVDVDDEEEEAKDAEDAAEAEETSSAAESLVCWRDMTAAELASYTDAKSGTIDITAEFDEEDMISIISLTENVNYGGEDSEPVEEKSLQATGETLDATTAANYHLPIDKENNVDLSRGGVKLNWEGLGFICE